MQCCAEAAGVAAKQLRVAVARQERETSDMENRAREMTRKQRQALSEAVSAEKKTRAAESAAERWRTSHAAAESENRSLQKRITAQQERSSSLRRTLSERNAATVQERFESLLREWDALLLTDAYLSEHGSVRASRSSSSLAGLEVAVRSRCVARALTHLRNLDGTLLACEKARDETAGRERELSVVRAQRAAAERELDQAKRQRALVEREVQHHTRVVYRLNEQALPALRDLAQQAARQATLAESMCLSLAESNQDRLME
jgi:chromosome segregation ATPase